MANGRHCKRVHGEIHRTWFTSMEPLTTWYRCMGSPMTTWALSLIQSLSDMGPGGLVTSWEEPEHMSTPRWAPPRNFNQTWDPWDFDETVNLSRLAIESDCEKQGVASHWSVWMVRHCGDTAGPTLCHREWGFRQTPQNLWMFNFYRTSNLHQICTSELKHCKSGFWRKVILVRPEEGLLAMQSLLLMTLPDKSLDTSLGMPLVWNYIFLLDISLWFVCDNATSPPSVPFLFLSFSLVYGKISAFLQNHTCRLDMIYIHIYAPLLIIYNLK